MYYLQIAKRPVKKNILKKMSLLLILLLSLTQEQKYVVVYQIKKGIDHLLFTKQHINELIKGLQHCIYIFPNYFKYQKHNLSRRLFNNHIMRRNINIKIHLQTLILLKGIIFNVYMPSHLDPDLLK